MKNIFLLFITFTLLVTASFISCGPLMQKPIPRSDNATDFIDSQKHFELTREIIPYYNTLYFTDGQGYEFKNANSDKLLITLDGGPGWFFGRIGAPCMEINKSNFVNWLLFLYDEYTIFVPEKFDWGRGTMPFYDIKNREKYTIDNLIANYARVIKEYLLQNDYKTIVIAGFSEGGKIAPELFFHLEDFDITALISIAAGGLSHPNDIAIARDRPQEVLGEEIIKIRLNNYQQHLATYGNENYTNSPDEIRFRQSGNESFITLMWRYSLDARRQFEFYKNINIPVLFIHGQQDTSVSVVSTRYVERNLPDKPFTYVYYPDMAHYPDTIGELKRLRADIAAWLRAEGL